MPPDFGNPNIVLGIIGAGAALVYFVYTLQMRMNIFSFLLDNVKTSPEERSADLLQRYHQESQQPQTKIRSVSAASPRLQMLRAAQKDGAILCFVVNKGGTAINLSVETAGDVDARIEPANMLATDQTASITLTNTHTAQGRLQFQLSYDDSMGMRVMRSYSYSSQERKFIEF